MREIDICAEALKSVDIQIGALSGLRGRKTEVTRLRNERVELVARLAQLQLAEVTAERDALRKQLATAEADMQACYRRHGEVLSLAEERLAWAHQLQTDIEAEQRGRLALRQRFGAREDETMTMWIERLATERDALKRRLDNATAGPGDHV